MYGEQLLCISIHVIQSELNYNITVRTIDKMKKIQKKCVSEDIGAMLCG